MFALIGVMVWVFQSQKPISQPAINQPTQVLKNTDPIEPTLVTEEVISGLSRPWDVAFLPEGTMIFNERGGEVSKLVNGKKQVIADINEVYAVGEGGLTGLTLDADFTNNRYLYTCYNARTASGIDVRLVRWKLSADASKLEEKQAIVTGIPSNSSGRHSGCRVRSDKAGNLWVGTGDAAAANNPQDPKSLGGKILHITRDGMPAGRNLPAPFDPRIFSSGHRNVQGLVLFDTVRSDGVYGYSIEHGSNTDDEINLLKNGNFGWAPRAPYNELGVPMTDTKRFPNAVSSVWSSGFPTIAPSGGTLLVGNKWGTWRGALAMAVLKDKQVRIMRFDSTDKLIEEKTILKEFGRVRTVALDLSGDAYITTDNGRNDKIIKVIPTGN